MLCILEVHPLTNIWIQSIYYEWMNLMKTVILLGLSLFRSLSPSFIILFIFFYYLTQANCSSASTVKKTARKINPCRVLQYFSLHPITLNGTSLNVWWKFMFAYQLPTSSKNEYLTWQRLNKKKKTDASLWMLMWFLKYTSVGDRQWEMWCRFIVFPLYLNSGNFMQQNWVRENIRNLI